MSLTLTQSSGGDFTPHPEGIFPAVCVDVIDLGPVTSTWEGQTKTANKLRIVFETEQVGNDHKRMTVSKSFTASLHPKAKLTEFLGKWRGKPVADGESIDITKLLGACCTVVLSQGKNETTGKSFVSIDAVSKPTKKIAASGDYNKEETRKRMNEWRAKNGQGPLPTDTVPAAPKVAAKVATPPTKSAAAKVAAQDEIPMGDVDPEVGF